MRLAELRVREKLTQGDLAELLGVSQGAVGNWERGIRYPRITTLRRIAGLFGVSIDYLLGDDDDKKLSA